MKRFAPALAVLAAVASRAGMSIEPVKTAQAIDWQTSPLDLDLRGMNGERYEFQCAPGKPQPSRVAGSGPYADNSSICSAAVHAGALHAKDGGVVAIEIRPGQPSFRGSERNYIASGDSGAWSGSFIVLVSGSEPHAK